MYCPTVYETCEGSKSKGTEEIFLIIRVRVPTVGVCVCWPSCIYCLRASSGSSHRTPIAILLHPSCRSSYPLTMSSAKKNTSTSFSNARERQPRVRPSKSRLSTHPAPHHPHPTSFPENLHNRNHPMRHPENLHGNAKASSSASSHESTAFVRPASAFPAFPLLFDAYEPPGGAESDIDSDCSTDVEGAGYFLREPGQPITAQTPMRLRRPSKRRQISPSRHSRTSETSQYSKATSFPKQNRLSTVRRSRGDLHSYKLNMHIPALAADRY